jgi:Interferon-induced transmembrane protein
MLRGDGWSPATRKPYLSDSSSAVSSVGNTNYQEVTVTETPTPESSPPQTAPPEVASTHSSQETPPPIHAGWAVTSLLFFWPLSFSAFTHAFNVYPLWARGDVAGAQAASDRVRRLGQISLWLAGVLLLLLAIGYTVCMVALITHGYGHHHHFHHMGGQNWEPQNGGPRNDMPHGDMPRGFDH